MLNGKVNEGVKQGLDRSIIVLMVSNIFCLRREEWLVNLKEDFNCTEMKNLHKSF